MPDALTSHERMLRVYAHEPPDRVPLRDAPWGTTIARWRREGLPAHVGVGELFGFEKVAGFGVDNSPRYPTRVVDDTPSYTTSTTPWGTTLRNWKHTTSTPEFIDFKIVDRESWADARERMTASEDRVDWASLERHHAGWRASGCWIEAGGWFSYDAFASWIVGTERMLIAMVEDPDWCRDMFEHATDVNLKLLSMAWDRGYHFDCLSFADDLGHRNGLFFSPGTYRSVVKPIHRRICDWAHDRGAKVMLHSCGNVTALLPDLIDAGIDGLNPLEQKAGMDVLAIKREFGDRLVLQGGIDVRAMSQADKIEEEIRTKVTAAKESGGYVYHSDHSVPDDVSFSDYCRVIALVKHYGK